MQRSEMVREYLHALGMYDCELNYEFLCELVARHVATFAFSSVGCHLGGDLPLDFDSLFNRIVVRRRGGYCFEQNGLLYEVLQELRFSPELYLARVIYNQDSHPGLTHRISIVEHKEKRYVLDVGFGPLGPRVPVQMSESETNDGDRVFRVEEKPSGDYHMQVLKDGEFFSLYRFELARYGQSDCELGHFYSHRHPDAAFVNHLVVSRILASEVRSLRDLEYWVINGAEKQTTRIGDHRQLTQILVEELGIRITDAEGHRLFAGLDT
ncbi:MAG: arylamine N-acetyltransferase [Gammaproteobacteria bacterium]|nr:arylamine N-acetyltransferase [Gammaproteobacteria bacterium]